MPIRRLEKTYTGTSGTIGADELTSTALASVEHVKPHIQPGVLYPAVANIMLDGSTALSASSEAPIALAAISPASRVSPDIPLVVIFEKAIVVFYLYLSYEGLVGHVISSGSDCFVISLSSVL